MIKLASDTINRADIDALCEWLQQDPTPRLTKGELTVELEHKWANKIGTKHSVFVNSGSSAILLLLATLKELKKLKNDKIVVPALSWLTDVSSPMLLGMTPILCDSNDEDLSVDLDMLEDIFKTDSPAAFMGVSVLGLVPDVNSIKTLCDKYDVIYLEDNCESMGSKTGDEYLGTFGLASVFSMYYGHHLSTIEGGFINTNDTSLYHGLLMMRSHGWDRDLPKSRQQELRADFGVDEFQGLYTFYMAGMNVRSTDLQAFLGIRAIDKLDEYAEARFKNFTLYNSMIQCNELNIVQEDWDYTSNFAYPVINEHRNNIVDELREANIECRPLIAGNMANKPFWKVKYETPSLPLCERIDEFGFYLPNHQDLTTEEIKKVCNIVNSYGKKRSTNNGN